MQEPEIAMPAPKAKPGDHQRNADRADKGIRGRRPPACVRHPGAEHQRIAGKTGSHRNQNGVKTARIARVIPVAEIAQEAKARALQNHAEDRAEHNREREFRARSRRAKAYAATTKRDDRAIRETARNAGFAPGVPSDFDAAWKTKSRFGMSWSFAPYLPPQTVPATFTTGTPTELPYSVQEPS